MKAIRATTKISYKITFNVKTPYILKKIILFIPTSKIEIFLFALQLFHTKLC